MRFLLLAITAVVVAASLPALPDLDLVRHVNKGIDSYWIDRKPPKYDDPFHNNLNELIHICNGVTEPDIGISAAFLTALHYQAVVQRSGNLPTDASLDRWITVLMGRLPDWCQFDDAPVRVELVEFVCRLLNMVPISSHSTDWSSTDSLLSFVIINAITPLRNSISDILLKTIQRPLSATNEFEFVFSALADVVQKGPNVYNQISSIISCMNTDALQYCLDRRATSPSEWEIRCIVVFALMNDPSSELGKTIWASKPDEREQFWNIALYRLRAMCSSTNSWQYGHLPLNAITFLSQMLQAMDTDDRHTHLYDLAVVSVSSPSPSSGTSYLDFVLFFAARSNWRMNSSFTCFEPRPGSNIDKPEAHAFLADLSMFVAKLMIDPGSVHDVLLFKVSEIYENTVIGLDEVFPSEFSHFDPTRDD